MKRWNKILMALSLVLILAAGIGSAWAYFTTYAQAQGGYTIELGERTEIREPQVADWTKHVVITADADSQPVYVRARAYSGSTYTLDYDRSSPHWIDGKDGWYYYDTILNGGDSTEEFQVHIDGIPEENLKDGDSFDVVVVYEYAPVIASGTEDPYNGPDYAGWELTVEGGGE